MQVLFNSKHLILISFCLIALFSSAQAQVSFEAYVDAKQIVLNSYLEVNFTLKNADGANFRPPKFEGFSVLSGPNRSSSTTIINGKVSKEISLSYTLKPDRKGKLRIGSASIKTNGKILKTKPVPVEVLEGSSTGEEDEAQVYVKAVPNVLKARVGQQIILDYKLYTTIDIDSYNVLEESTYQGFFAKDIKRYDFRIVREVIDGKQYVTKIIKRVALYPQQAGLLTIDPMHLQMGIVSNENKRSRSFFFNKQVKRLPVQTEAIQIEVEPLPPNPPASFSGAVGNYKINTTLNRKTFTTDDVISLRMAISGNGDIKRVQAPEIKFPDNFEVYDPKILDESTFENKEGVIGKKMIEYLALPKDPGTYEIEPEFSYYSTDSAKYVTSTKGKFEIIVRQGANRPNAPEIEEEETVVKEDIHFIKTGTAIPVAKKSFFGSNLFWIFAFLPLLLLGSTLAFKQYKGRLNSIDPKLLKSRKARKVAQKRLSAAEQFMKSNNSRAFYNEISKAMLGYVCDKLRIPLSELTKDNVQEQLQALEVKPSNIEQFMTIIRTTEMAIFAGKDKPDAMQETYQKAVEVIAKIEEDLL